MEDHVLPRHQVDIGGAALDAAVLGDGQPTVVFVNGLGSPLEEWALVAPRIAESCRVVCYDRRAAPRKGPVPTHTAEQSATDLHRLLQALEVAGPVVLVGHSWGGAIIRRYAHDHPDDVAGTVFVDASHEGMKAMIPKRPRAALALYTSTTLVLRLGVVRRRLLRSLGFDRLPPADLEVVNGLRWIADGRTGRAEYAGIGSSLLELARIAPDLPRVPTSVLLAGGRPGLASTLGAKQTATIRAVWEQAVAARDETTLASVVGSGHYISLDEPQAVIDAVEDVISRVSAGAQHVQPTVVGR